MATSRDNLLYVDADAALAGAGFNAREREILDTVNRKVAAAESLDGVMSFVFEAGRDICPCDRIGLAFVEEDGRRVVARWAKARYEPLLLGEGYAEDLAGSSLERLLQGRRLRIIHDLEAYLREHPESRSTRVLLKEGVRASLTAPLRVEDRTVGLLFRSSRRPGVYGEREVRLHLAMAERLAQAVEKAWRIQQLEAVTRAYTEMLGFVAHELKSPVASMVMQARAIGDGYLGPVQPEQKAELERMIVKGNYLLGLVRDYLELARLEGGDMKLGPRAGVDFEAMVVQPALDVAAPLIAEKKMRVTRGAAEAGGFVAAGAGAGSGASGGTGSAAGAAGTPAAVAGPVVECDPELLLVVMVNLLGNAAKYGREGGEIRVSAAVAGGALRVSVRNEGPGFPESQRGRLFRRFSRLQTPDLLKPKGTGVGLYTCWRIVNLHGGRIWADSQVGEWAEFMFAIPQPLPAAKEGAAGPVAT